MSEIQDFNKQEEAEKINLKGILLKYIAHWKWFLLSIGIMFFLSKLYLKYTTKIYEAKASVLVKNQKSGLLADLGKLNDAFAQKDEIEDEIEIIKSLPVLVKTAEDLKLNVIYQRESPLSKLKSELYFLSPIAVNVFISKDRHQEYSFFIENIDKNKFLLKNDYTGEEKTYNYNTRIAIDKHTTIIVKPNYNNFKNFDQGIFLTIRSIEKSALELFKELNVLSVSKHSNAIALSIKGPDLEKNKTVLNEIIAEYFNNTMVDKKNTLVSTGDFVKGRIILLDSELKDIENEIKIYKQDNRLTDLVNEAEIYSKNMQEINQKVFDAELQLNLVNSLNKRLNKSNYETLPVNQGLNDQSINLSIAKYNELVLNFKNLSPSATELNPERQILDNQLKGSKYSITEGLKNQKNALELTLDNIKRESNLIDSKLRAVPAQEKEIRDITRQHQTKEALFLYLLQKREEIAISEKSIEPNARLINYAFGSVNPVEPIRKLIYFLFLAIGFIIPVIILYIKFLLDTKIHDLQYIENNSLIPNIGIVPLLKSITNRVLLEINDRSSTAEAFRLAITNVEFILAEISACKTILFTSTISGEGKSFVSSNFSSYLAHSGKKVVLLGFDLRAPKLDEFFDYSGELGITHFVKKHDLEIEKILNPVKGYDKFDIIHAGITVPNFVEMMKNSRIESLFAYLKENYDYIIIDSAPIGLVSDTLNLAKYTDLCLYVIKAHYLDKSLLPISNKLFQEKKFVKMKSLFNAVDVSTNKYGYGYGYGYRYGYGYGNQYGYGYGARSEKDDLSKYRFKFWHINFYKNLFKK